MTDAARSDSRPDSDLYGETAMDGPNTHRMDAPAVTEWAVIPTTRDVPSDDGLRMEARNEWWHVPTFVVGAIEAAALRDTGPRPDSGIDPDVATRRLLEFVAALDISEDIAAQAIDDIRALSTPRTETSDD